MLQLWRRAKACFWSHHAICLATPGTGGTRQVNTDTLGCVVFIFFMTVKLRGAHFHTLRGRVFTVVNTVAAASSSWCVCLCNRHVSVSNNSKWRYCIFYYIVQKKLFLQVLLSTETYFCRGQQKIVSVCFCNPQMWWNCTFVYVATFLHFFKFIFILWQRFAYALDRFRHRNHSIKLKKINVLALNTCFARKQTQLSPKIQKKIVLKTH